MDPVGSIELVAEKGILGNPRHFARLSRRTGQPTRRQVSLIEREQLSEHAAALGLETIAPGEVRANIETTGIALSRCIGKYLQVGGSTLLVCESRTPCERMNLVWPGLRQLMEGERQGVLAQVIESGSVRTGDPIRLIVGGESA